MIGEIVDGPHGRILVATWSNLSYLRDAVDEEIHAVVPVGHNLKAEHYRILALDVFSDTPLRVGIVGVFDEMDTWSCADCVEGIRGPIAYNGHIQSGPVSTPTCQTAQVLAVLLA